MQTDISLTGIARGFLGIVCLILLAWVFSTNRKKINWKLVIVGLLLQIVLAIGVFWVKGVNSFFEGIGSIFVGILGFTREGTMFLFGNNLGSSSGQFLTIFAFHVLPTIVFFSAFTSLLYYFGILQKIVYGLAWVMKRTMGLSGAESLAAAANVFIGQTEAPLVVKPYLAKMTKSEMLSLMTGGMATIAGGVMVAFIGFLAGPGADEATQTLYATHLLTASLMSAPAALLVAKILVPETEEFNRDMKFAKLNMGSNILEVIANGTTEGLKLAVNVGAMLLVFIAMMAMANYIMLHWVGELIGVNSSIVENTGGRYPGLTLEYLMGYIFSPIAWLIGVNSGDMLLVGQLLGEKTILNEFYAYGSLGKLKEANVFTEQKSIIIATYALCGFSNFASIGIQIGGIGALAPEKRTQLSQLGIRALLGGTIACLLTASVAGMFF
jgi:concentrative nucleoside transporter, CNT family